MRIHDSQDDISNDDSSVPTDHIPGATDVPHVDPAPIHVDENPDAHLTAAAPEADSHHLEVPVEPGAASGPDVASPDSSHDQHAPVQAHDDPMAHIDAQPQDNLIAHTETYTPAFAPVHAGGAILEPDLVQQTPPATHAADPAPAAQPAHVVLQPIPNSQVPADASMGDRGGPSGWAGVAGGAFDDGMDSSGGDGWVGGYMSGPDGFSQNVSTGGDFHMPGADNPEVDHPTYQTPAPAPDTHASQDPQATQDTHTVPYQGEPTHLDGTPSEAALSHAIDEASMAPAHDPIADFGHAQDNQAFPTVASGDHSDSVPTHGAADHQDSVPYVSEPQHMDGTPTAVSLSHAIDEAAMAPAHDPLSGANLGAHQNDSHQNPDRPKDLVTWQEQITINPQQGFNSQSQDVDPNNEPKWGGDGSSGDGQSASDNGDVGHHVVMYGTPSEEALSHAIDEAAMAPAHDPMGDFGHTQDNPTFPIAGSGDHAETAPAHVDAVPTATDDHGVSPSVHAADDHQPSVPYASEPHPLNGVPSATDISHTIDASAMDPVNHAAPGAADIIHPNYDYLAHPDSHGGITLPTGEYLIDGLKYANVEAAFPTTKNEVDHQYEVITTTAHRGLSENSPGDIQIMLDQAFKDPTVTATRIGDVVYHRPAATDLVMPEALQPLVDNLKDFAATSDNGLVIAAANVVQSVPGVLSATDNLIHNAGNAAIDYAQHHSPSDIAHDIGNAVSDVASHIHSADDVVDGALATGAKLVDHLVIQPIANGVNSAMALGDHVMTPKESSDHVINVLNGGLAVATLGVGEGVKALGELGNVGKIAESGDVIKAGESVVSEVASLGHSAVDGIYTADGELVTAGKFVHEPATSAPQLEHSSGTAAPETQSAGALTEHTPAHTEGGSAPSVEPVQEPSHSTSDNAQASTPSTGEPMHGESAPSNAGAASDTHNSTSSDAPHSTVVETAHPQVEATHSQAENPLVDSANATTKFSGLEAGANHAQPGQGIDVSHAAPGQVVELPNGTRGVGGDGSVRVGETVQGTDGVHMTNVPNGEVAAAPHTSTPSATVDHGTPNVNQVSTGEHPSTQPIPASNSELLPPDWDEFIRGDLRFDVPGSTASLPSHVDRIEMAPVIHGEVGEDCGARAVRLNNMLTGQDVQPLTGAYTRSDFTRTYGADSIAEFNDQGALLQHMSEAPEGSTFLVGIMPRDPSEVAHVVNAQVIDGQVVIRDAGYDGKYHSHDMEMFTAGHPEDYSFFSVNATTSAPAGQNGFNIKINLPSAPSPLIPEHWNAPTVAPDVTPASPMIPENWNMAHPAAPSLTPASPFIPENWNVAHPAAPVEAAHPVAPTLTPASSVIPENWNAAHPVAPATPVSPVQEVHVATPSHVSEMPVHLGSQSVAQVPEAPAHLSVPSSNPVSYSEYEAWLNQQIHEGMYAAHVGEIAPKIDFNNPAASGGGYVDHGIFRQYFSPGMGDLPSQGYKLHVAGNLNNALAVNEVVLPILQDLGVTHKTIASEALTKFAGLEEVGHTTANKFITIYPNSDQQALEIANRINKALSDAGFTAKDFPKAPAGDDMLVTTIEGARSLGAVHARYGGFTEKYIRDPVTGQKIYDDRNSRLPIDPLPGFMPTIESVKKAN